MKHLTLALACSALSAAFTPVSAQESAAPAAAAAPVSGAVPAAFVGQWTGKWVAASSNRTFQGDLDVNADGTGSWKTYASSRASPCFGKTAPVEIGQVTPESLVLHTRMSKVISGCDDYQMTLTANPGGVPTAQWSNGNPLVLTPR